VEYGTFSAFITIVWLMDSALPLVYMIFKIYKLAESTYPDKTHAITEYRQDFKKF
jgi:hypothetical protein